MNLNIRKLLMFIIPGTILLSFTCVQGIKYIKNLHFNIKLLQQDFYDKLWARKLWWVIRAAPVYLCCICHTHRRERCTNTNTHRGTHAHAQVGHTHVAFVCVAKKAIKIFSLQILFCFISPFLFVSSSRCVRECVCVSVYVWGRKDGTKVDIGLFAYASHTRTLHSALHSLCQGKNLFYMYLYACLALILVDSTRQRLDLESCPSGQRRMPACPGCCRWLLPLTAACLAICF